MMIHFLQDKHYVFNHDTIIEINSSNFSQIKIFNKIK